MEYLPIIIFIIIFSIYALFAPPIIKQIVNKKFEENKK